MKFEYLDVRRALLVALPELRDPVVGLEEDWRPDVPGLDELMDSTLGAFLDTLLGLQPSPRRDALLCRAFGLIEDMLRSEDREVRNLTYIGILERRGSDWYEAALPFLGDRAISQLNTNDEGWRARARRERPSELEPIELYGIPNLVAELIGSDEES